jgi:hypothetical protein
MKHYKPDADAFKQLSDEEKLKVYKTITEQDEKKNV